MRKKLKFKDSAYATVAACAAAARLLAKISNVPHRVRSHALRGKYRRGEAKLVRADGKRLCKTDPISDLLTPDSQRSQARHARVDIPTSSLKGGRSRESSKKKATSHYKLVEEKQDAGKTLRLFLEITRTAEALSRIEAHSRSQEPAGYKGASENSPGRGRDGHHNS